MAVAYNLVVRARKGGEPYWEAKWRVDGERLHDIAAREPRAVTSQAFGTLEPPRQVLDDDDFVE